MERDVEKYFKKSVEQIGGLSFKFTSPSQRGVSDRIACLPDGTTWFVEIKTAGGKLSPLQVFFADQMKKLNQNYACLWSKGEVNAWIASISNRGGGVSA